MQGPQHGSETSPLRIGAGGDLLIERTGGHTTIRLAASAEAGPAAQVEGRAEGSGRVELGGWGITEALRRGATTVTVDGVAPGGLVAGPAAWHFGWDRSDWDELAAAVVAGRILARAGPDTVVELHADGSVLVTPATPEGVIGQLLGGLDSPDLVEPDATVRLYTIRLRPSGDGGVVVHSVRGLPGPATALVERDEPAGWRASATFAVAGLDPDGIATAVWDAAGGAVEVHFTRRERPSPETWSDTIAELRASVVLDDAHAAERTLSEAVAAVVAARIPGVTPVTNRPAAAWPVRVKTIETVPATDVEHIVVVDGRTIAVPPAPTQPPPLARRTPDTSGPPPPVTPGRKIAPTVSTHPETIAALRDDLARRRLAAGPADDDSVHWDAQPAHPAALGQLVDACAAPCRRPGSDAVSVAVWVGSEDAYDWLQWHLDADRFRSLLPAQVVATIERVELPNLNALGFVINGEVEMPVALLGEYVRAREVELPDELYPSSALRTSAT